MMEKKSQRHRTTKNQIREKKEKVDLNTKFQMKTLQAIKIRKWK